MSSCAICGMDRAAHGSPDVHHHFSEEGNLIPKGKQRSTPANAREHIVAPGDEPVAVRLAAVLHSRGKIDDAELVYILTGGKRPDGSDSATRPGATGDLRAGATSQSS